jgi:hypothetical protein
MSDVPTAPVHLTPDDYHVIGPQDFNAPGLSARESIGPFVSIRALGPLLTIHDSRFEANTGKAGLVFVVGGEVHVTADGTAVGDVGTDHTVLLPPGARARTVDVVAGVGSRIIRAVTGQGYGFRRG